MVSVVLWLRLRASVFSSCASGLTLGSLGKSKPTLQALNVWAAMRPACTSFLLFLFFFLLLFYNTGLSEPPACSW